MQKILLIIPSYNEEDSIRQVVRELISEYPQFDYVVVNDGSTDQTGKICREEGFCFLDLPVNLGLSGCFQTGMKYAYKKGYECAIQFDGDGQHLPRYIEDMKKKMDDGYDIIIGSRFLNDKKGFTPRMIGSRMIEGAIRLTTGVKVTDPTSGMRMFNKKMIQEFAKSINFGPEPDTISYLLKQGAKIAEVPVVIQERKSGESYLNAGAALLYMVRILISILLIQNFRK